VPVSHLEPSAPHGPAKRGNLRLFFGGSAGFTAVRTMLESAAAAQQRRADVVVCLVNSRGSGVIEHLLRGFECLPALQGHFGAKHPPRIDVDAIRKREPAILLVDTRVPPHGLRP
jgi:two-component system sensor histidine kinase KdpD